VLLATIAVASGGCASKDDRHRQQSQAVASIRASVQAAARAWISAEVSTAYTRDALAQLLQLLDSERSDLDATPADLTDSDTAALSQECERLSRHVARLWKAADEGDRGAAQQLVADVGSPGARP
jgi:hypothetical protein